MVANTVPEPPGTPVLGHAPRWVRDPFTFGSWVNETAGGVAKVELLNREIVIVTDPDPIEEVLVEKRELFPKSDQYEVAFGEGLASVSGDQWRTQRDAISEFFRPRRIDSYADTVVDLTDARSSSWTDGDRVDVFDEMKDLTLEVLFETIFDYPIDPDGEDAHIREAVDNLDQWFEPTSWVLPEWVPTPARRRFGKATARIDAIADELLEDADGDGLLASLRRMRRDGGALTDEEIRSQLRTFLFAGHETTASTLSFALQLLGTHPDVESRLHAELDSVLDGRRPGLADLDDLAVTENVIHETLRLYPPPFRMPRVAAEGATVGGYDVPAGTDVLVFTVVPHRDGRFWERPTEFRPGRWDDLDPETTGFEYIPFGAGPRACIGRRFALLETRMVLATLGRTYRLVPESDLEISAVVAATPRGSLPARVQRR